jgi:FkbM family methyltransferase
MAMKFYGQFEPPVDQFIYERYFIGRKTRGVLIECGAFDGITECSGNFFEETLDWACVNVEPYPPAFAKLVVNRPKSTNINLALSSTSTSVEFTAVVHPVFGEDCNNGSISHTARHRQDLDNIGCSYRTYRVATTTYSELVSKLKLVTIDLLVLDVEGHEPEVLKGMQQTPHSLLPKIICVEHGHLGVEALKSPLEALGYTFDTTSFVNSFYVRNDIAAVLLPIDRADRALPWQIIDLEAALRDCRAERDLAQANLSLVANSRSIKLTAPLRWLMARIRRK